MIKIIKRLLLGLPFVVLFIELFHPIYALEEDLGRHLLFGEIITLTHKVPDTNLISYTFTDFPYVLSHWLSELIFYFIVNYAGFDVLLLFKIGIFMLAFGLLYLFLVGKINLYVLVSLSLLFIVILFERATIRPEMFGFLLLSISMVVYYSYRKKFTYLILLLIPLEILWVNLQINFPFGPIIGACFLIEEIFQKRKVIIEKRKISKHTGLLFLVLAMSTLSALLNPNFIDGLLYPLTGYKDIGHAVKELQNIFTVQTFGSRISHVAFGFAVFILGFSLVFSKKPKIADTLIAIIFIILGVSAIRNIPFFIFALFIATNIHFNDVAISFYNKNKEKLRKYTDFKFEIIIIFLICLAAVLFSNFFISKNKFGFGINQERKYAVDFFIENDIKGPIFNDSDYGQYFAYRLFPKEKVFIDVRETYPASFYRDVYFPMNNDPLFFKKIADEYKINSVIYYHVTQTPWTNNFVKNIVNNPDWVLIYVDDSSIILVRNNLQNKKLIEKYGMTRKKIILSHHDMNSVLSLRRLSHFFLYAGWGEHVITMNKKILELDPNSCTELYYLAKLFNNRDQVQSDYYAGRFNQNCK